MPKVHSHYENLKVARDAPPEAIRAAYRALTRKHHPDRHPDSDEAQRIMAVVNVAYAVLSDPVKRREHDLWIRQAEAQPIAQPLRHAHTLHSPSTAYAGSGAADATARLGRLALWLERAKRFRAHVRAHRPSYTLAVLAAFGLATGAVRALLAPGLGVPIIGSIAQSANHNGYVRPPNAPNGHPWPARSGYVEGYPQLNRGGLSDVTVDNSRNDVDMFAKLVSLDGPVAVPVRTVFVAAHARFKLAGLSIGTYDLRYRNLATGALLRTPAFILEEVPTAAAAGQRNATAIPLYAAGSGNLQTYELGESEF
jgi:hypothetical protein